MLIVRLGQSEWSPVEDMAKLGPIRYLVMPSTLDLNYV